MITNSNSDKLPMEQPWPWPAIIYLRSLSILCLAGSLPCLPLLLLNLIKPIESVYAAVCLLSIIALAAGYGAQLLLVHEIRTTLRDLRTNRQSLWLKLKESSDPEITRKIDEQIDRAETVRARIEDLLTMPFALLWKWTALWSVLTDARKEANPHSPIMSA